MSVDSFKYMPRVLTSFYQMMESPTPDAIPWAPLPKPLAECTLSAITTGGLYQKGEQEPFDLEREKQEKTWGDPSYRPLPSTLTQEDVGVSHLHINTAFAEEDFNVLLPLARLQEQVEAGRIGRLAPTVYSFMGFQGFPADTAAWENKYGPQVIEQLKREGVDAVLLAPA